MLLVSKLKPEIQIIIINTKYITQSLYTRALEWELALITMFNKQRKIR